MNVQRLSNDALVNIVNKMGREMTAASSTRTVALEKERIIYVKELMRRGLIGMPSKKKYRLDR